ncbi:hypothetical protein VE02_07677 [Pseudogymnoascus sp. 03VT05]|nr:hypothetical protein VE02_07677 [Pseudogymnoascus sp. 03VT05]
MAISPIRANLIIRPKVTSIRKPIPAPILAPGSPRTPRPLIHTKTAFGRGIRRGVIRVPAHGGDLVVQTADAVAGGAGAAGAAGCDGGAGAVFELVEVDAPAVVVGARARAVVVRRRESFIFVYLVR